LDFIAGGPRTCPRCGDGVDFQTVQLCKDGCSLSIHNFTPDTGRVCRRSRAGQASRRRRCPMVHRTTRPVPHGNEGALTGRDVPHGRLFSRVRLSLTEQGSGSRKPGSRGHKPNGLDGNKVRKRTTRSSSRTCTQRVDCVNQKDNELRTKNSRVERTIQPSKTYAT